MIQLTNYQNLIYVIFFIRCFPGIQIDKILLTTHSILYQTLAANPMSHFYLYPLLLSQEYQPFQIQQILHSFGLFGNNTVPSHPFPLSSPLQQNFNHRPSLSRNLILQQNTSAFSQREGANENLGFQLYNHHPTETQDHIKEEHGESQEKTSDRLASEKSDSKSQETPKNRKKKRITKMSLKEKREKQLKRNQTENSKRNVIPNEIHQMLSILFKKKKSTNLVEKLIAKYTSLTSIKTLSVQRFYLYQSLLKEKINHYANEHSLKVLLQPLEPACRIYQREEQAVYCKMGLSLIRYFLNNEASLVILNSKRIKSENKLEHLKTKRYLAYVLTELINSKVENLSK